MTHSQALRAASLQIRLRRAIDRLVRAEVADSWKGGGDPADWPLVEAELHEARRNLRTLLKEVK